MQSIQNQSKLENIEGMLKGATGRKEQICSASKYQKEKVTQIFKSLHFRMSFLATMRIIDWQTHLFNKYTHTEKRSNKLRAVKQGSFFVFKIISIFFWDCQKFIYNKK